MEQVPLLLVFGAGLATLISPCGYALLPAYFAYHLGGRASMRSALKLSAEASTGVFIILALVGLALSFATPLIRFTTPHLTLASAIIISMMGVVKAFNLNIPLTTALIRPLNKGSFFYGVAYIFAASGCAFPIFFSVIVYASLVPGLGALVTMLTYGLGISIPLFMTGIAAAKTRELTLRWVTRISPMIQRTAGLAMIIVGAYLLYFYYYNYLMTTYL